MPQLIEYRGTVKDRIGVDLDAEAQKLKKAIKALTGVDKQAIVDVLCSHTNKERQNIASSFKSIVGKDLTEQLRATLSGEFLHLLEALMETPVLYDAMQMHKAIQGLGTKESVLIEIMSTRTNAQIRAIKTAYERLYDVPLEQDLIGDTSGFFRDLLVMQCKADRDETDKVDLEQAKKDATALFKEGEKRFGKDASIFYDVMAKQNIFQLRALFDEYQKIGGTHIYDDIENNFSGSELPISFTRTVLETGGPIVAGGLHGFQSGKTEKAKLWVSTPNDIKQGLLAIVKCAINRAFFFAQSLHASMEGIGTSDNDLIRVIVTRCEVDMVQIKEEYNHFFKTPLEERIPKDCSGQYASGLVALVKGN
jgi:hypothetical protein